MISKNKFPKSKYFLIYIFGILWSTSPLISQIESEENYSDSLALNNSITIMNEWNLFIDQRAYDKAQQLIWEQRNEFKKSDYQLFVVQVLEQYTAHGIIPKKFELHEKLINWFSKDSVFAQKLVGALLQEYIEEYYLIEAEILYKKFSSEHNFDFEGSRLYRRFNEIDKSFELGQRAIDNYTGPKNMDYYHRVGNLSDAYYKLDFNKADSLMDVCFNYFMEKDEAMFDFYYTRPIHSKIDFQILKGECDQLDTLLNFVRETIKNNSFYKELDLAVNDFHYARYLECIDEVSKAKTKFDEIDFSEVPLLYKVNIQVEKLLFAMRHDFDVASIAEEVLGQLRNNYINFAPYLSDRVLINYNFNQETFKDKLAKTILLENHQKNIQKQYLEYEFIQKSSFYYPRIKGSLSQGNFQNLANLTQDEINKELVKLNSNNVDEKSFSLASITFNQIQKSLHQNEVLINLSFLSEQNEYVASFIDKNDIQHVQVFQSEQEFIDIVYSYVEEHNLYTNIIFFPDGQFNGFNYLGQFGNLFGIDIKVIYGFQMEKDQVKIDKIMLLGKSKFRDHQYEHHKLNISADLPAVRLEIQSLNEIMTSKGYHPKTYLDDPHVHTVFSNLNHNSADIIHVATHGIYNTEEIDNSLSYFNPKNYYRLLDSGGLIIGESEDSSTLHLLDISDVNQLNIENSELVSLLSCHSGFSNANDFYGSLGLARAFIKSGAKNVITTSGLLSDELSLAFSKYFYAEYLNEPEQFNTAINNANRKTLADFPHVSELNIIALEPFIIKGNRGLSNKWFYLIAGFGLLFFTLFFLRKVLT